MSTQNKYKSSNFPSESEVIGVTRESNTQNSRFTQSQIWRRFAIISLLIALVSVFIFLLTISISLAAFYGVLLVLFIIIMLLPSDKPSKDLERIKRDIDRRTHFVSGYGGGGKGLIHFEGEGPAPYDPRTDEEKL